MAASSAAWVPTMSSTPDLDAGKRTAHLVGGRMVDYIEMEKDGFSIMKLPPTAGGARLLP